MFNNFQLVIDELKSVVVPESELYKLTGSQGLTHAYTDDYEQVSYTEYYTYEVFRTEDCDTVAFQMDIYHDKVNRIAQIVNIYLMM